MCNKAFSSNTKLSTSKITLTVTGYCECKICCGWKRNWRFQPVYAYGPSAGKPKKIGITASGTKAVKGTIAADTKIFPYGTIIQVPGYGIGRVEDIGGAIKGRHIDLFFNSHKEALEWGRQKAVSCLDTKKIDKIIFLTI